MDAVINLKGVGGPYNSFQNALICFLWLTVPRSRAPRAIIEAEIMAYPFQTETTIADWHYQTGQRYVDAKTIVGLLMQNVSRNGAMLLNLTQHGRGDLDPEVIRISKDVGAWLKINGQAVYGSRPFEVCSEKSNTVIYTRNNGLVYVTLLDWDGGPITLNALRAAGATLGKVSKVELLGSEVAMEFVQDDQGLTVTPGETVRPLPDITARNLASRCRVFRITHDKGWFNDDDPGVMAAGWMRRSNLDSGDFNNDSPSVTRPAASGVVRLSRRYCVMRRNSRGRKIEIQITANPRKLDRRHGSTSGPAGVFK